MAQPLVTALPPSRLAPVPHNPAHLDVARVGRWAIDRQHYERPPLATIDERVERHPVVDADDVAGADAIHDSA